MREVSDGFLLNLAEVSASLIGLFLVGIFFYIETGFRRTHQPRSLVQSYLRSSARIVLILYSIPLVISLTLVVLEVAWSRVLLALLSAALVAANVDTALRIPAVNKATSSMTLFVNEVVGTVGVAGIILVPWILGGFHPTREEITWALLLAFATGFLSICATVLSAFDIASTDPAARDSSQDR